MDKVSEAQKVKVTLVLRIMQIVFGIIIALRFTFILYELMSKLKKISKIVEIIGIVILGNFSRHVT